MNSLPEKHGFSRLIRNAPWGTPGRKAAMGVREQPPALFEY